MLALNEKHADNAKAQYFNTVSHTITCELLYATCSEYEFGVCSFVKRRAIFPPYLFSNKTFNHDILNRFLQKNNQIICYHLYLYNNILMPMVL